MAKGAYIGVDGVARKVTSPYIGVNGVARNVKSGYVGVDGVARLFFAPERGTKTVLQVAKQTLNTYTGETEYTDESFVAINVYPKTNGTVKVTYGGLTKTITDTSGAENPNAQTVYFGTLYGVTDSVATPDSGELTIEGQFQEFGCGTYRSKGKFGEGNYTCSCITAVSEWGEVTAIPIDAFYQCTNLALTSLPSGITSIGNSAFYYCSSLALTAIPNGVTSIGNYAFWMKTRSETAMRYGSMTLPSSLESIGTCAFAVDRAYDNPSTTGHYAYLREIIMLGTIPPTLQDGNVFGSSSYIKDQNGNSGRIVVPAGCIEVYRAAENWGTYINNHGVEAS